MRRIETEIEISAEVDQVWRVLTDFARYPDWNPFIRSISGELEVGAKLRVDLQPPGRRAMRFKPKVIVVEPAREFAWTGRVGLPWVFDGEHRFVLESTAAGTRLQHREQFRGLATPLFWPMVRTATPAGFALMNEALKTRVEQLVAV